MYVQFVAGSSLTSPSMIAMRLLLDFAVNGQLLVYWGFLLDVGVANGRFLRIRYCEDLWLGASRAMIYRLYSWIAESARAVGMLLLMDLVVGLGCRGRSVQRHGPGERYLESTRAQTKAQAAPKLHDRESREYPRDAEKVWSAPIKREARQSFPQFLVGA